ncbi:MAG: nucleoside hydrolase [Methylobacteriaceae bacterium]|nr:nucleoside hydrolase [Methylobacteriaceae bacterium]
MHSQPVLIDCDPGIDDTVALLVALASPELDVRAITTVSGNRPVTETTRNALQVLDLAGRRDIPVYAGCFRPLILEPVYGQFHGTSGMGPVELPPPSRDAEPVHAVDFIIGELEKTRAAGSRLTLCALGPLTNLALVLRLRPDLTGAIRRIVLMGGAFRVPGNRSMTSEFNILVDPHAAHIVFSSDVPLVIFSLDVTTKAMATPERVGRFAEIDNPVARTVAGLMTYWDRNDIKRFGSRGGPLHDPLVILHLIKPELFGMERARVFVQHEAELTIGQTVADWFDKSGLPPNADIAVSVDVDGVFALLNERLSRYGD